MAPMSKRVNSSRGDASDATLIEPVDLAAWHLCHPQCRRQC